MLRANATSSASSVGAAACWRGRWAQPAASRNRATAGMRWRWVTWLSPVIVGRAAPVGAASASHHAASFHARTAAKTLRSEEHTSELQSRENLVCRLLLEKKNLKIILIITILHINVPIIIVIIL